MKEGVAKTSENISKGAISVADQIKQAGVTKKFIGLFKMPGASSEPAAPLDDNQNNAPAEESKQPQQIP